MEAGGPCVELADGVDDGPLDGVVLLELGAAVLWLDAPVADDAVLDSVVD